MRITKFIKEHSGKNYPLPTPDNYLYRGTVFYTLDDAIKEGMKWVDDEFPFPRITLEDNGYYRFWGHGKRVAWLDLLFLVLYLFF